VWQTNSRKLPCYYSNIGGGLSPKVHKASSCAVGASLGTIGIRRKVGRNTGEAELREVEREIEGLKGEAGHPRVYRVEPEWG